jgi:hypothetical protein
MKKPWLTIFGLTAFLTVVSAALIFWDNSNQELRKKIQTGSTQAKITALDMSNHATAYFEYAVGDKLYRSSSSGWGGTVNPGDSVILHYNPNDPVQSSLGEYRQPMPYIIVSFVAAITVLVSSSYYLLFVRPRYRFSKPADFSN